MKTILFVSHQKAQCGIYEFGKNVFDVLKTSREYSFVKIECSSLAELEEAIKSIEPSAIIYNYHPSVLPWISTKVAPRIYRNNITHLKIPQISILHEVSQSTADKATSYRKEYLPGISTRLSNSLFDFYIAPDPTLLLRNPYVYKTGRLIPEYQNNFSLPSIPTIGSFGFGTPEKGFDKIVNIVQEEFDEAIIKFNIPFADFGDKEGINAKRIAEQCRSLIKKPGIQLQVTHDFLNKDDILNFLAQNSVNAFLYESQGNRGLSSTIDNAMAVKRPIAISESTMFRHLFDTNPSVIVTRTPVKKIIDNGFSPLEKHYKEWSSEILLWEYERILHSVFKRPVNQKAKGNSVISHINRLFSMPDKTFSWITDSAKVDEDDMRVVNSIYEEVEIPEGESLNRILDNSARNLYKPSIKKISELVPKTIAKKIPEANVQQGFVFDTVYRYIKKYESPRILCVGSFEDTAAMSLKKMGFKIEEIDPVLNYYLQEYVNYPSTKKNSYDIIFSTSVIEHDPDDESFIKGINELLAPGGVAILTCDYDDQWEPGKPKPDVDERLYTRKDLKNRLLPLMNGCELVDMPKWECPSPDFNYLGKYQYTFASMVVKKNDR